MNIIDRTLGRAVTRRSLLKAGAATAVASQAAFLEQLAVMPQRATLAASSISDIQFDIGAFVAPAQTFNDGAGNVVAQFGVVFALLTPARLTRNPTEWDQAKLSRALDTIEDNFAFSPAGVFTLVHWGLPYFNRLPRSLVRSRIPRLLSDPSRLALEESPVFPTDVSSQNPGIVKDRFQVPVVIETNDVLFMFRSDSVANLASVQGWLEGSNSLNGRNVESPDFDGLFAFQAPRLQFVQPGLPRKIADATGQEFAGRINPRSSMTMGFVDQAVDAAAPAPLVTFAGTSQARFTNARPGDYFDNGSIAHFSHDIEDLFQFYSTPNQDARHPDGESFQERLQYMFRSNQLGTVHGLATEGNADQFTNGGGAAFVPNLFQGSDTALRGARASAGKFAPGNQTLDATFTGLGRIGHEQALQRSSRLADGTPVHIRNDGPGFDGMDVPAFQDFPGGKTIAAGTPQFKLQFLVFVPTAEFFRQMRVNAAAQDLQAQFKVDPDDNGMERFISATRRQNFLTPPRRHRAFPLLELVDRGR